MGVGNNGKTNRYYACNSRVKSPVPETVPFGSRYARAEIVDATFWALLEKVCADPASLASYIANMEGKRSAPTSPRRRI